MKRQLGGHNVEVRTVLTADGRFVGRIVLHTIVGNDDTETVIDLSEVFVTPQEAEADAWATAEDKARSGLW